MSKHTITILGSGTSTGVPIPGCFCAVCRSSDAKDKRFRTSLWLQFHDDFSLLVDTTPDLRSQALNNGLHKLDATIITHAHADHLHGIDDLRPFCFRDGGVSLPLYTYDKCAEQIQNTFAYIFDAKNKNIGGGVPQIDLRRVELEAQTQIGNQSFQFFLLPHGYTQTLAFIQGKFGYIIDCKIVPPEVIEQFKAAQLDLLILDCLRPEEHPTHLHQEQALNYAQQIQAKETGLIHMGHSYSHQNFEQEMYKRFSGRIFPVYDGLKLTYSC